MQNVLQTRPIYQSVVIMNCMQSVEMRSCKSLAQLWCRFLSLHISVELNLILNKRSTMGVTSEAGNFIFCSFFLLPVHCLSDVRLLATLRYISTYSSSVWIRDVRQLQLLLLFFFLLYRLMYHILSNQSIFGRKGFAAQVYKSDTNTMKHACINRNAV